VPAELWKGGLGQPGSPFSHLKTLDELQNVSTLTSGDGGHVYPIDDER
jgi:hypothetical protein